MNRIIYVIESDKGYLKDVEQYTNDLLDAVTFSSFDTAQTRLCAVHTKLKTNCWIGVNYMRFPREKPAPVLAGVYNTY